MEMVIPPRDHGPSTYRYTWDENGEVTQVTRVEDSRPPSTAHPLPSGGRYNAQWPFQSFITTNTTDSDASTHQGHHHQRPFTAQQQPPPWQWQPTHPANNSNNPESENSTLEQDIVPDYVVSFLRGETPDHDTTIPTATPAPLHRGVDIVPLHQNPQHRSR
ncbi:hypothetical protein C8A00DRAFT_38811, partial [Chaetomidium leptoderma]